MAQSKARTSRDDIGRGGHASWREASQNSSALILSLLKEAATTPLAELKEAACVALLILETIRTMKENKEAYERLGDDAAGLIVAIWRSFKKAEGPRIWLSEEMREILEDATRTLEDICSFIQDQCSKNKALRIFNRPAAVKINEYREDLKYVTQKFELQSHMKINEVLIQLVRKNDQLSEHILYQNDEHVKRALEITAHEARDWEVAEKIHEEEVETVKEISALEQMKQVQMDCRARDEQWHSDELKKIEMATKDRESELERLRAAANAIELANRLKKAREEEAMAKLDENIQRRSSDHAQSSRKTNISRRQEDVEEELKWEGTITVEEPVISQEEEELRRPVKRNSKEKKNSSNSPKRRSVTLEECTDEEEDFQDLSSKMRRERRKVSNSSLRVEETEDESTHAEASYVPPSPRKSPRVDRSSSRSPPRAMDDVKVQVIQFGNTHHGSKSNSRSGSPKYTHSNPYLPMYGLPFSPPIGPYGYDVGVPGMIVNSGIGNITNTTISNVGNDHSVKRIYLTRISRRLIYQ